MTKQPYPLSQTKLYVPPTRREFVSRPRLIEQLTQGMMCKLMVISAPAGFGKTTPASEWVRHVRAGRDAEDAPLQVARLSLDKRDNEPARFLAYSIAALRTLVLRDTKGTEADLAKGMLRLLLSPQPPPAEAVLTTLINDLAAIQGRIALVLDDYYLIIAKGLTNPEIATRLFVSVNTFKAHTRNIYGKLAVHSRTQAAVRATALGSLPST